MSSKRGARIAEVADEYRLIVAPSGSGSRLAAAQPAARAGRAHTALLSLLSLAALAAAQPAQPAQPFSIPQPARTITVKMHALPPGEWTTIASLPPGTAGVVKQLQLWTAGPLPAEVLFKGTFDQASAPHIGSNLTSVGTPATTLALDVFLSPAFYNEQGYEGTQTWFTDTSGCNYLDESGVGGHYRIDMPFSNGLDLELYNAGSAGFFWVIVTYVPLASLTSPLRLWIKPFSVTGVSSTVGTYPEISMLGVSSPNGVFLKGVKVFVEAPPQGISWAEGKFRFYAGGPGFATNTVHAYNTTRPDDLSYYNQLPGVDQLGSSSGGEDFFVTGFDWRGGPCFAHDLAGTVHCDFYNAAVSRVTAYRFFGDEGFGAPPDTPFVATFTCNDQNFAVPSSMNFFLGISFYYA